MGRRHNQYRNRATRAAGHEDMDMLDKKIATTIMEKMGYECHSNLFLAVPRDPNHPHKWAVTPTITEDELKTWKLAARPDVYCIHQTESRFETIVIIEIDGDVHRGDLDERPLYTELGIKHIIVNKTYLKQEGITWEAWIRDRLKEMNLPHE